MDLLGHDSEEEFLVEKKKSQKGYRTHRISFQFFQLIDKASGKIIGGCGFHNWHDEHKRAEIGYNLKYDSFKRLGLMTEALPPIIDYGLKKMQLNRMEAFTRPDNVPSVRLLTKFGFKKEGLLKQHYLLNGVFEDSVLFARLVDDSLR